MLIPRPETERLIDEAIKSIKHVRSPNIFDIGTGSGCIAITLAKEIEKQVTQNYLSSANTLPPTAKNVNIDSLREAQGNLKFNPEQIDKLNTINEINKDIKEQVDSIKSKTYNFNLNNLK